MIAPFQCAHCNAPLAVVDAPTLVCRYCGTINQIPAAYHEELRLARDLDQATRRAIEEWAHLDDVKVPRWWFVCAATIPFLLLTTGLGVFLAAGLLRILSSTVLPSLIGVFVWFPLVPAAVLAAKVGLKNLLVSGAARVGVAFAAIPPVSSDEPPNCRQCGAPLAVEADDILVRCLYCGAESFVRWDVSEMQALQGRVGTAQMSLAQAMEALSKRAKLAALETRGRLYIIAGLLVVPLIWSFVRSVQSSYWSLLIALDVWVLGICALWTMREAFLPPVTIEELDALRAPPKVNSREVTTEEIPAKQSPDGIAGTRGWYEHAFDGVNFVGPLFVALMFVAVEVIVLGVSFH
jgi:DNA-directed RNA polymerase subunit RPC12/RpoP